MIDLPGILKSRSGQRWCASTLAVFFALVFLFVIQTRKNDVSSGDVQKLIFRAIETGDFETAIKSAESIPVSSTAGIRMRFQLAESLTKKNDKEAALRLYEEISALGTANPDAVKATFYQGKLERDLGRLSKAEQHYRTVLQVEAGDVATNERLTFLLTATGRTWEANPHLLRLVKSGAAHYSDLSLLADLERSVDQQSYLADLSLEETVDPLVELGLASQKFWDGHLSEAESALSRLLSTHPEFLSGQAMLGELLVNRDYQFLQWHDSLPSSAAAHPRIWLVRGLWARRHKNFPAAARCFWESIRLDPTGRRSIVQLGQVLQLMQDPAQSRVLAKAEQLSRLTQLIDEVLTYQAANEAPVKAIVEILLQNGRIWEACSWAVVADTQFPGTSWPAEVFSSNRSRLTNDLPQVNAPENLGLALDFSDLPVFEAVVDGVRRENLSSAPADSQKRRSIISFSSGDVTIPFDYFNSSDPNTSGARSFEQTGGAVAVLDYDADDQPDLFFTQGTTWPTGSSRPVPDGKHRDTLLRQDTDYSFMDSTQLALPVETGFGQGCAAGDYDNDGFTDLYVANVGRNQLLINQGDGTFLDQTETAGLTDTDWTASVVMADLNGDSSPDLFDVNYLSGQGVYETICNGRACSPKAFSGTEAKLHLNMQNGRSKTIPYGSDVRPGKGLGVVCFPLASPNDLGLFISNDQVANQLLRPSHESHTPGDINLVDTAFIMGAAYNGDGVAMAGMGIAAEDVDGNGLTDFYVSNFKDEPNTLLLQDSEATFIDSSGPSGLKGFSLNYVGWGTQFLDADRDSLVDLVLVNGHVDDYRDAGGEYQMPPQFFHQARPMQFEDLSSEVTGTFFQQKRHGRGLSRLDWNRDGLMDFVVSSINEPAQLVTNTTRDPGHFINVRLISTQTARDAIGTRVTMTGSDGSNWTKSLMAGDGYMASNERTLQFGLGSQTNVLRITVEWPSGTHVAFEQPGLDSTWVVVEGRGRLYILPTP